MREIRVFTNVPQSCPEVFEFLDVLANHEQFTDHMMRNWHFQGPERGIGAKVKVDVILGGRIEPIDIEVVAAESPRRTVERNVGAGGRRIATGTYALDSLPDGGTRIHFTYAWQQAPFSERLLAPIIRGVMRKALQVAMERLVLALGTNGRNRPSGPQ